MSKPILWTQVFQQDQRQLGNRLSLARGRVSPRNGITSIITTAVRDLHPQVTMTGINDCGSDETGEDTSRSYQVRQSCIDWFVQGRMPVGAYHPCGEAVERLRVK